jgi:hypothetical protein
MRITKQEMGAMKGQMHIIAADGEISVTPLTGPPGLKALQKAVGGLIEIMPGVIKYNGKPCVAFCNENGKLAGLPFNETATKLMSKAFQRYDIIVGDVVIITGDAGVRK